MPHGPRARASSSDSPTWDTLGRTEAVGAEQGQARAPRLPAWKSGPTSVALVLVLDLVLKTTFH